MRTLEERFAGGDPLAVREAYEQFQPSLIGVAHSVLNNRDLAADAVQTAFLNAWRAAGRYDPERPLEPWRRMITRRAAIDAYRSRREGVGRRTPEPVDDGADEHAIRRWRVRTVRAAVERLPENERELVDLAHLRELSHREVSDRLGIPIGTVKSRLRRAHRRLAEELAGV
ncbi:RNA polymerase sigma factor [Virgisporangium ochraceum]